MEIIKVVIFEAVFLFLSSDTRSESLKRLHSFIIGKEGSVRNQYERI
jgi:hypothetical protein